MSKKVWSLIFGIPVLILILVVILMQHKTKTNNSTANTASKQQTSTSEQQPSGSQTAALPPLSSSGLPQISATSSYVLGIDPNYSASLARYNFTGRITKIEQVSGGTQLDMDITDPNFPGLLVRTGTRISTINYVTKAVTPITVADLKQGNVIDFTMDFEKNNKVWILRDIYVPSERN